MPTPFEDECFRYQAWLKLLSEAGIPDKLRRKVSPDDIVQETFIRAIRSQSTCQADLGTPAFRGWLSTILKHVLIDTLRHYQTDKRNFELEDSVGEDLNRSAHGLERLLALDQTSPSVAAARRERHSQLAAALTCLPCDQRDVITRHYLQAIPLSQIADGRQQSMIEVTRILRHGLEALRILMV